MSKPPEYSLSNQVLDRALQSLTVPAWNMIWLVRSIRSHSLLILRDHAPRLLFDT